jgi:hypothetical protein
MLLNCTQETRDSSFVSSRIRTKINLFYSFSYLRGNTASLAINQMILSYLIYSIFRPEYIFLFCFFSSLSKKRFIIFIGKKCLTSCSDGLFSRVLASPAEAQVRFPVRNLWFSMEMTLIKSLLCGAPCVIYPACK